MPLNISGALLSVHPGRPPEPVIPVRIVSKDTGRDVNVMALLDTGAARCVMPFDTADLLGLDLTKLPKVERHTAGGIKTAYLANVRVFLDGADFDVEMDFALGWDVPVIGHDILKHAVLRVDYPGGTFSLKG